MTEKAKTHSAQQKNVTGLEHESHDKAILGSLPQPSTALDHTISLGFMSVGMILTALQLLIPSNVFQILQRALSDIQGLYTTYKSNPSADIFDEISSVLTQALGNLKDIFHPSSSSSSNSSTP